MGRMIERSLRFLFGLTLITATVAYGFALVTTLLSGDPLPQTTVPAPLLAVAAVAWLVLIRRDTTIGYVFGWLFGVSLALPGLAGFWDGSSLAAVARWVGCVAGLGAGLLGCYLFFLAPHRLRLFRTVRPSRDDR